MISIIILSQCKLEDAVANLRGDASEKRAGGLRVVAFRERIGEAGSRHGC